MSGTVMVDGAPYLPFADGRFRLAMGLAPVRSAGWLEPDGNFAADLAAKRALLASRPGEVFAALPGAAAPAAELLALLAAHLALHHPALFRRDGARLHNLATGEGWDVVRPALHPLDLCGRLAQEDFCLLGAEDGPPILIGATLCAPARWRLAEKLGRPLGAIHAPVPGYDAALAQPVDRLLAQLKPGPLVGRVNWSIADDPQPFQPVRLPAPVPITAANAGDRLWLRVERQTLRKLPGTGATVFTIRTHITRLERAIATAATAAGLAAALRDMAADMQRYKQIAPFAAALLAWLDARAAGD